jgi:hypothetical protein
MCGAEALQKGLCVSCVDGKCRIIGPNKDPTGEKWNALMAPHQKRTEAKAGTVRVRARVWLDADGGWQMSGGNHFTKHNWDDPIWKTIAFVTADVPLPTPSEIEGSVE